MSRTSLLQNAYKTFCYRKQSSSRNWYLFIGYIKNILITLILLSSQQLNISQGLLKNIKKFLYSYFHSWRQFANNAKNIFGIFIQVMIVLILRSIIVVTLPHVGIILQKKIPSGQCRRVLQIRIFTNGKKKFRITYFVIQEQT